MVQNNRILAGDANGIILPYPTTNRMDSFISDKSVYDNIDEALKWKEKLKEDDVNNVILTLINRKRFKYSASDILAYVYRCMCLRKVKENRRDGRFKPHFFFKKCEELLNEELDIVSIMKHARLTNMLSQIILNQKQKMLMRFQRKHLVETSSDSQDSDTMPQFNTVKLMDSKNPIIKLSIFGRLKRMVGTYRGNKLELLDRRILRGLY